MNPRHRLDSRAPGWILRMLPLALLGSILLHALAPATPERGPGSTFRADTANVCVAAGTGQQLAEIPLERIAPLLPALDPGLCPFHPAIAAAAAARVAASARAESATAAPAPHGAGLGARAPPSA